MTVIYVQCCYKYTAFVNFVTKTPGMLYMVLVCMQNCLFIFKNWQIL